MSAPRTVPPAPAPAPVPLPNPQNAPTQKKYSEGSMYEDLSPEDVEAWHRRYSEFKKWRQEIPNKGVVGAGSAMSLGQGVGVGSADWTWREPSDNGTIPSTVVERAWETARARSNMGPQAEPPAPSPPKTHLSKRSSKRNLGLQARVETVNGSETPPSQPASRATTIRPPLTQKPVPSRNIGEAQVSQNPLKTPTIETQPPSSKTPHQVPLPSSKPAQPHSQRPPTSSAKPTRPPPTPLLARPPSAEQTTSEPKIMSRSPSTRGSLVPGEQVVPSPTPSAKYAEREAYIASALSLPLDMLAETEGPPRVDSSSHFTTGRLDSLLGKSRSGSRTKGSQRSARSSTTLPSVRSDQLVEKKASQSQLARSKTTSAVPIRSKASERTLTDHREHHYEGSNHLPVPGAPSTKAKPPSDATVVRAANQPLPPSTHAQSQATTKPPLKSSHSQATDIRSARPPARPAVSDATVIRASREPLPLSVATSAAQAETIKVPASVKTVMASSGPATRAPPSEATVIRAGQVPLPTGTGRTGTVRTSPSIDKQQEPLSPRNVPLPPTAPTAASTVISRKEPAHRQQMPLPRPALTPQPSFDGLTKPTSLGRKHRDPSLGDLTAHFEPSMYPLPPSGATLFSSPKQVSTLPPRTVDEHAVAFSTVEYIEPESLKSTTQASTPAPQPSVKPRSNKSVPPTPGAQAAAIPLPPSTAMMSVKSTPRAMPSAPAPSAASPPAPPPPPVTSPVELSHTISVPIPSAEPVSRPSSHRLSQLPVDPISITQSSSEPRSATHTHPHIHFSPGQVSQSLRSEDDHVSFEVPSGSRGRLRVTLKWFREGGRSERSSPRAGRLSVVEEDAPPPVPPKTTSLMSRVMGNSTANQKDKPQIGDGPRSTHRSSQVEEHRRSHPVPDNERPELSPPPPKRDNLKSPSSDDQFPPNQQAQQQHHPSGPAPYYNPYYSGATLPAYAAAMPQVYNMFSPPMAYPQPGLPAWGGPGGYRPQPQNGMMGPPHADPASPARESVDLPSDMEPPPPRLQPQQFQYPPQMNGYAQQGYWNGMARPSIWQRMFRRPSQGQGQGQEDNLGPDDSVTIRNWAEGVQPGGKAPTMLPTPQRGIPTIIPNQPRPTLANTAYPGMMNLNTSSGPGTTLYNVRGEYPFRSRGDREGTPSVWEKLMYRRQTEEAVYRSPPRKKNRGLPDPAPSPSPLGRDGRRKIFSRSREVSRNKPPNALDVRRDRYAVRQREKEERRRQRSLMRDQRANANAANQPMGEGLRREQFLGADMRDRPGDLAGLPGGGRGRSGTLVGEWVGRFGMARNRGQFPHSESQVRNYQQPRLWKDRLGMGLNNRSQRNATTTPGVTPTRPQAQDLNGRGQRATLRRTLRTTERIVPGTTGGNALGLGLGLGSARAQTQGPGNTQQQGMRGMIGRFGLGNGNTRNEVRGGRRM
ncbi:hypothetical protein I302_108052 [Kwoniella bestiolae CBS 10118]|uniref:Uncharacterized protein n=1 Tax=Kwoniella bestiolae CBS 10118 TaxID=1296100 RepID=A0A1B9FWT6_9TREE|nr:hypothetical protein I302_07582 [Kwoniella bestiolae CBS 10118]OCF23228.1 hypothetical protein I302_07582 [Kwoniella bestiolae CBS 10118]